MIRSMARVSDRDKFRGRVALVKFKAQSKARFRVRVNISTRVRFRVRFV